MNPATIAIAKTIIVAHLAYRSARITLAITPVKLVFA